MPVLPRSLLWRRLDTVGTEHTLLSERSGLYARGTMIAADPIPYTCEYELLVDEGWATVRLNVTAEGAGWLRSTKLERAAGRWRVTAGEQGDLDVALMSAGHGRAELPGIEDPGKLRDALDVDLGACLLTNTPPVRRLGLLHAAPGTASTLPVAWVQVPTLEVVAAQQTYTALGGGRVRYADATYQADLTLDDHGYVTQYPGLAERA
jgi:hypothetical protein